MDAVGKLAGKIERSQEPAIKTPPEDMSFYTWLHTYASVKVGNDFVPYSVEGRQPLLVVILVIDYVLGNDISYAPDDLQLAILGTVNHGGPRMPIPDAREEVCGGAQFGKTILALLLKVYLGTVKFRASLYALPDDDLVDGIIDLKERPEVLDQIAYVGDMLQMGKALTRTGRAVNRKGAMLYTDGNRSAVSMMRGLGKIPTSFSADVVVVDERDDVKEEFADFLPGRMTTSDLRFMLNIGTQRYHGAGQNALFLEGSQHVGYLICPDCGRRHNPEEEWPAIARMSVTGTPSPRDPQLDNKGTFAVNGETVAKYRPDYHYYFGCVACGAELDREAIDYEARQPDMISAHHWSIRVSQMCCSALPVAMFVSDWCTQAVRKKRKMAAFNCDRLAIPKSTGQKLTPGILDRSATVAAYKMEMVIRPDTRRYGGLDTGDLCWFAARDHDGAHRRLLWAESIADSDTRQRAVQMFATLKLDCLFVDAGPLRDMARDLALDLNGLRNFDVTTLADWKHSRIRFPGGVEWNGEKGVWVGLKCAPVEFTGRPGSGIQQQARLTPDNRCVYPVISCNRDEAVQGVIDELLTAEDGLAIVDEITGELRTVPEFLLPAQGKDEPAILATYRKHFLAGSCKEKDKDGKEEHFVDGIPNHLLLATTYARLAEMFAGAAHKGPPPPMPHAFTDSRRYSVLRARRERTVVA